MRLSWMSKQARSIYEEFEDAERISPAMVQIGNNAGRKTKAIISDMSQPLGFAVGNALEVKEAIDTLKRRRTRRFT